jgi:hypothetical protein
LVNVRVVCASMFTFGSGVNSSEFLTDFLGNELQIIRNNLLIL